MRVNGVRKTLKAGSIVFGSSALILIALPSIFIDLLTLDATNQMQWSMRMIGVTVFALAGNMWLNSEQISVTRLMQVAQVMFISAAGLGILTLLIPVELTWFTYFYAAIGFGFAISYFMNLIRN